MSLQRGELRCVECSHEWVWEGISTRAQASSWPCPLCGTTYPSILDICDFIPVDDVVMTDEKVEKTSKKVAF
jgi:uncharacterized Zn finger protein